MISGDGRSWNYLRSWLAALIYFLQLFRRINAISFSCARGAFKLSGVSARSFLSHRRLKFRWGIWKCHELLINWRILLLSGECCSSAIEWIAFPTLPKLKSYINRNSAENSKSVASRVLNRKPLPLSYNLSSLCNLSFETFLDEIRINQRVIISCDQRALRRLCSSYTRSDWSDGRRHLRHPFLVLFRCSYCRCRR